MIGLITNKTERIQDFVHQRGDVRVVWLLLLFCAPKLIASEFPEPLGKLIRQTCLDCHNGDSAEGGLDLASLTFKLDDRELRDRWILIHDRIRAGEMPPDPTGLSEPDRQTLLNALNDLIAKADRGDVIANGRGPLRRLTREEFCLLYTSDAADE